MAGTRIWLPPKVVVGQNSLGRLNRPTLCCMRSISAPSLILPAQSFAPNTILGELSANRNVWSAALPQAKSDVTGWSAQMYTAFVGVNSLLARMECAALFSPLVIQPSRDFFRLRVWRAPENAGLGFELPNTVREPNNEDAPSCTESELISPSA